MLAAAAGLLLLPGLGATDLWAPDEPRYAQVAEELRSAADPVEGLVVLRLNGEVYTQKPPLYFWLAALAGAPGARVTELAARLPSALAGIACVWGVARFGAGLVGGPGALLGGALLLTSFEFAHLARRSQLDVLLTLFEGVALLIFWRLAGGSARRRPAVALLHGALGLAVLTKGPVGLLVPALVIAATLAWERRLSDLKWLAPPWAWLLSMGPGLLWLATAAHLGPEGFVTDAVGANVLERFFAGTSHARPFYYYLYQLPLDFLPWTLLWPLVAARAPVQLRAADTDPDRRRAWRFLLCWIGVSVLFFSLSAGKRGLYLLPAFPALALLCADAVVCGLERRARWPRAATAVAAAVLVALSIAGALLPGFAEPYAVSIPGIVAAVPALLSASALAAWLSARRYREARWIQLGVALATVLALQAWAFLAVFPRIDPEKSPRPVAVAAARLVPDGEPIGLLAKPSLLGGLLYYGGHPVVPLEDVDAVERYLAAGGRAIVAPTRRLDRLRPGTPLRVAERFRRGRRELQLLVPET